VKRRRLPVWASRGGLILLTLLIVEYFVLPQLAGARSAVHLLSSVTPGFLVLGLLLELASLISYSALTRCVLPAANRPPLWTVLRIDLTGLGLSHLVPCGGATATALRFRLFTSAGMQPAEVLTATAIEGVGTALVLIGVFAAGLLVALPSVHDNPVFVAPAAICAVLLILVAAGGIGLTWRRESTLRFVRRATASLPRLDPDAAVQIVARFATRLTGLLEDRQLLRRSLLWATANWLFDAASLWVFLRAFGQTEGLRGLLVGYGLAGLLALLPLSPGGLGIVEGTLVSVLVGFGTPHANAVLGVITWRLAEFWLPIPLAALTYLSLRTGTLRHRRLPSRPLIPRPEVALPMPHHPLLPAHARQDLATGRDLRPGAVTVPSPPE
jgi:uncharacterized protein (TIRG00374 family)